MTFHPFFRSKGQPTALGTPVCSPVSVQCGSAGLAVSITGLQEGEWGQRQGRQTGGSLRGGGLALLKDVYKSEGVKIKRAMSSGNQRRPELTLGSTASLAASAIKVNMGRSGATSKFQGLNQFDFTNKDLSPADVLQSPWKQYP